MNPPFLGTRVLDNITLDDVASRIDLEALFSSRWQFRSGVEAGAWEDFKQKTAVPTFERILSMCSARGAMEPKILYGYFRCAKEGNALIVDGEKRSFRFEFPRERSSPNRCLADFFQYGFAAFSLCTVGAGAGRVGADLFKNKSFSDAFFLKGLAAEAAEALAKLVTETVEDELGAARGQGERFSPGYPPFPDLFEQRKIASLLKFAQVGVTLTKTCHLVPENSTTAMISVDPEASHFRP